MFFSEGALGKTFTFIPIPKKVRRMQVRELEKLERVGSFTAQL